MPSKKLILGLVAVAALIFTASSATKPKPSPLRPNQTRYDVTLPGGTTGLPRSVAYCNSNIILSTFDPHGENAYNVPRDDLGTGWTDPRFSWWSSYSNWTNALHTGRRDQIDGHYDPFVGVHPHTNEIFSIAACRWGLKEDLLRAVAVQESDWHEHGSPGDQCLPQHPDPNQGYGSYGLMQVKHFSCQTDTNGQGDWGGFPRTWYSATFNVDFYGAAFRACLEQSFWYTIPAGDNIDRREKGCVGAWFSGTYNPDIAYVTSVYNHLAAKTWLTY